MEKDGAFTRAKDETLSSAQYGLPPPPPPPRLLSIIKCYVPGIASCGSRPPHSPPNHYGSPFSSMHVKFALSDQRLRLPSSSRVLTDEGKRPSFV